MTTRPTVGFRMRQASRLKSIMDSIKELVFEAVLEADETGIKMQAMDACHIVLCTFHLTRAEFTRFWCDQPTRLGVSIVNMASVLACTGPDDEVGVSAEHAGDVLSMAFMNPTTKRKAEFAFRLNDINTDAVGIPDTPPDGFAELLPKEFKDTILDVKRLHDNCKIAISSGGISFDTDGPLGRAVITLVPSAYGAAQPVTMTFSVKFLVLFTKAAYLGNVVRIELRQIGGLTVICGCVRFYLSPMMQEEE